MKVISARPPILPYILRKKETGISITTLQFFKQENEEEVLHFLYQQPTSKVRIIDSEEKFSYFLKKYKKILNQASKDNMTYPKTPNALILRYPTVWPEFSSLLKQAKEMLLSVIYLIDYSIEASSYADKEIIVDENGQLSIKEGREILSLF